MTSQHSPQSGRIKHHPGDRFGSLVITERLGKSRGSTRVRVQCDCGNVVERSLQNLTSGATSNCADRAHHPHPGLKTSGVAYSSAHHRVRKAKGPASSHRCVRCAGPAEQWAYSNGDLFPLRDASGREAGLPYSTDPEHYAPMCRSCHTRFDKAHRAIVGDSGAISLAHVAAWHLSRGVSALVTCQ